MSDSTLGLSHSHIEVVLTPGAHDKGPPSFSHVLMPPIGASQSTNKSSLPKNHTNTSENSDAENDCNEAWTLRYTKCLSDLETMTAKMLELTYKSEHTSWRNSKCRSKALTSLEGQAWGQELDTFPGFLRVLGPKPNPNYSLDRIDPHCGYVASNVRWASKQLQSENRKNVEVFDVRGVLMTKPQIANLLEISYDALRMRLYRGERLDDIVEKHFNPCHSKVEIKRIEDQPWPDELAEQFEAWFQAESRSLCPKQPESRIAYFVAKCCQQVNELNRAACELAEVDEMVPAKLSATLEWWRRLLRYAFEQQARITPMPVSLPHLGPSQDDIDELKAQIGL